MHNPINKEQKELAEKINRLGVNVGDRWADEIEHRKDAEELGRLIGAIDWLYMDDSLGLEFGGDGDNGENLIYILDIIFDLKEAEGHDNV